MVIELIYITFIVIPSIYFMASLAYVKFKMRDIYIEYSIMCESLMEILNKRK